MAVTGGHIGHVRRFFFDLYQQINKAVIIGNQFNIRIGVSKIIQNGNIANRTFQFAAVKDITGMYLELTPDDFLIGLGVSFHNNLFNSDNITLDDFKMNIQRIRPYRNFTRLNIGKQIPLVVIHFLQTIAHAFIVFFLIVNIAFVNIQSGFKRFIAENSIAFESNIAKIIFMPFINPDIDVQIRFIRTVGNGILYDFRIAKAMIFIECNYFLLIFFEFFRIKIRTAPPTVFLNFFHLPLQLAIAEMFVAVKANFFDLNFFALINIHYQVYILFTCGNRIDFHFGQ